MLAVFASRTDADNPLSALEVGEVDVCSQVLLARRCEQIARHAMLPVRGGGSEAAQTRAEKLFVTHAVIKRDDHSAVDARRELGVILTPLQRHIGELTVDVDGGDAQVRIRCE